MASIIKRGNKYAIAVYLGTIDGKKRYQWLSGFRTMKEAKQRKHEIESQRDGGIFVKPGKISLAQYLVAWLKDYVVPNLAPRTAEGYDFIVHRHIIPALGKIILTRLKLDDIQGYLSDKLSSGRLDGNGGLSAQTVKHHHRCLHSALEMAVYPRKLLTYNPAEGVITPPAATPEMHTLDEDGIHTFLEASKATEYYALFFLALYTGMRRSELLGLRWPDIDLDLCELSVNRSLHHLQNGTFVFRQPKTAKSRRLIALTPSTVIVLREYKEKQRATQRLLGATFAEDSLVFCQASGTPLLPSTVSHAFHKMSKKLGLNVRLHDCRHTHASLLLKQGVSIKVIQERLGHSSINITMDIYAHVMPGMQENAARNFDNALNNIDK